MRHAPALASLGCVLAAVALPATATADPFPAGATRLNTFSAANTGFAGPVTAGGALADGVLYRVVVRGTFSAWTKWPSRSCGRVEAAPLFASPGRADEPVGFDPEFRFAEPRWERRCKRTRLPRRHKQLQLELGDGWRHYEARDPHAWWPRSSHRYTYLVTGRGAPLQARLVDWRTEDNVGSLAITVAPA